MIKRLLRSFIYHVFALWLASSLIPALTITGDFWSMVWAGLTLSILMLLLRPLLSLIFLPINILTLGFLGWAVNVLVLYIWSVLSPQVRLSPWIFPGFSWEGFVVPPVALGYTWTLVILSLLIVLTVRLLDQLSET